MNQANAALFYEFLMSQQQKPAGASLPVVPPVPVPVPAFQPQQPPQLADFFQHFLGQPPPPPTPAAQSVVPAPPVQGIDHQLRADVVEIRDSLRELLLLQQQAKQQANQQTGNKGGNGGKKFGGGGGGGPYGRKFGNGHGGGKVFGPFKQVGGSGNVSLTSNNGGQMAGGNNLQGGQPAVILQQAGCSNSGPAGGPAAQGVPMSAAIQQPVGDSGPTAGAANGPAGVPEA
jgi:hypothetical protein